jgi:hypothetical protein
MEWEMSLSLPNGNAAVMPRRLSEMMMTYPRFATANWFLSRPTPTHQIRRNQLSHHHF